MIQGRDDEYGTLAQVEAIAAQTHGSVETLLLDECQHSSYRDRRSDVLDAMSSFVRARVNEAHQSGATNP